MQDKDYKEILEKLSSPIVVAIPQYEENKEYAEKFSVYFMNESFTKIFPSFAKIGEDSDLYLSKLSQDIPWVKMANDAISTGELQEVVYYSVNFSSWYKITMNATANKIVIITIFNVDSEKEREQQLIRQNLRLASLTDELSASRENLKTRLENINTLNEKLQFNAYHDAMTGLFGRLKFREQFEQLKKESQLSSSKFALILADIDNMKIINDSQGHTKGDQIICKVAELLSSFENDSIKVYRFGGDEFIILINNITSQDDILDFGHKVLAEMNKADIQLSLGFAVYPTDAENREELLKYADMAMYEIKKTSKNDVGFFKSIMRDRFMKRLQIQTKLCAAVDNDLFQLYYQPQFDALTNKLRGFEALLRWYDDEIGWINPEQFIPIAEETKLVIPLGDWILETAIKTLKKWQEDFNFDGIMSVNVSPIQLKKPSFIEDLKYLIKKYEIPNSSLEIEITEGVLIENKEEVISLLNQLREMNIGISLDDFGTGYSSLSYLQMLPITTLKIDKSFIANITEKNGVNANITDSIISMVTKMGLDTIAEGVENPDQLNILKTINCRNIQGFLKGKPMPKERCEMILNGNYDLADHL